MVKKILVGVLAAIVVVAIGTSAYRVLATSQNDPAQQVQAVTANGNGRGNANGGQAANDSALSAQTGAQGGRQGGGNGWGRQSSRQQNGGQQRSNIGTPDPQNGFTEWVSFQGVVSNVALPGFVLATADGQQISVELGNISYTEQIGLVLEDGAAVSLTGFWDPSGSLAVGQITLDATGETYILRDDLGRPMWSGGVSH